MSAGRLLARIGGVARTVAVREGQRVKRGEPLARIDAREIEARLAQARAEAEALRAKRAEAEAQLSAIKTSIEQAQIGARVSRESSEHEIQGAREAFARAEAQARAAEARLGAARRAREEPLAGLQRARAAAKSLPPLAVGMVALMPGLAIAAWFGVPLSGCLSLFFAASAVALIACLGAGILISTFARNLQQALSIAFFVLFPTMFLSGTIESMPAALQASLRRARSATTSRSRSARCSKAWAGRSCGRSSPCSARWRSGWPS